MTTMNQGMMSMNKALGDSNKMPDEENVIALDCEMVSDWNNKSMLARVSLVNSKLECIYDKYVKPTSKVSDFRTQYSGIREQDLMNGANFEDVQRDVRRMLMNKILVGHDLQQDFNALKLDHQKHLIRDTAQYEPFKRYNDMQPPQLKKLAQDLLNETIQEGEHSSIEDAKTAMKIYKKFMKEWEGSLVY